MNARGGGGIGGGGLGNNNLQQSRSLLQPNMQSSMIQQQHLQQTQHMQQQHYQQQQQQLQNQQRNQLQQLPGQAAVVQQQQQQHQQQQQLPQVVDEALMRKIQEKQNYLKTTYMDVLNSLKEKTGHPPVRTIFALISANRANPSILQGLENVEKVLHSSQLKLKQKLNADMKMQQQQQQSTNSLPTQMLATSSTASNAEVNRHQMNQPNYQQNVNSSGGNGMMMNVHQGMMTNNGNQNSQQMVRMVGQNQNQIPSNQQQVRMINVIRPVSNNQGVLPGTTVVHHRQPGQMALPQSQPLQQQQQIRPNMVQQPLQQQQQLNNNSTSIPLHVLQHMKPNIQQPQQQQQQPKVVIHHQQQSQQQGKIMFNRDPNSSNNSNFRQPQPMSNVFQNVNQRMENFAATRAASPAVPTNINNSISNQSQNMHPKSPAMMTHFQHQQQQQPSPGFLVQQPSPNPMPIKSPSISQQQQPNPIVHSSQSQLTVSSTASGQAQQANRCQLHEKMASLVEAVRRSMDRDQTTHLLLVQEAFAPALSVLHHRTAFSPRSLTFTSANVPDGASNSNKRKRTSPSSAQTCLHHELLEYSDRFSFTPLHRQMPSPFTSTKTDYTTPLPCTLLVRVVDPKLPNFPPATLYLPAAYPDAPASLSLSEHLWGPLVTKSEGTPSLFERVRSHYEARVGLLTQMNILRQLDLLHGSIRQVIADECFASNKKLRKSAEEEKTAA